MLQSPERSLRLAEYLPGLSVPVPLSCTYTDHFDSKSYKHTAVLIVGAPKESYILHKDLLCFYSDFFRAAFNGSFKEAVECKIELPDTEVDTFEAFQVWLYTQSLPKNEVDPNKIYLHWPLLVKLWSFGDKYQIPLLQNNVMNAILDKVDTEKEVPIFVVKLAYENTTSNSRLRKALVDIIAYRSSMNKDTGVNTHFTSASLTWPAQTLVDVMTEMDLGWRSQGSRYGMSKREKCY
jgi:hypothetical protein